MNRSSVRQFLSMTSPVVLMLVAGLARAEGNRSLAEVRSDGTASLNWSALGDFADVLVAMWDDNGPSLDPWGRPNLTSDPGGEGLLSGVLADER